MEVNADPPDFAPTPGNTEREPVVGRPVRSSTYRSLEEQPNNHTPALFPSRLLSDCRHEQASHFALLEDQSHHVARHAQPVDPT